MAQVINVLLEVGKDDVGSGELTMPGQPISTSGYREVTIKATFRFTAGEVGLKYRVYAYLYASDRQGEDTDNPNPVVFSFFGEDAGREQIAVLSDNPFSLLHNSYWEITVDRAGDREYPIKRRISINTLDEDPGFQSPRRPEFPPRLFPYKDELFARVILSTIGESIIRPEAV